MLVPDLETHPTVLGIVSLGADSGRPVLLGNESELILQSKQGAEHPSRL